MNLFCWSAFGSGLAGQFRWSCLGPLLQRRPHAVRGAGCLLPVTHMVSHPHPGSPRPLHSFQEGKSGSCQASTTCYPPKQVIADPHYRQDTESRKGSKRGSNFKSTTDIESDIKERYKEDLMKEIHTFPYNVFYFTLKIFKLKTPNHLS